MERLSNKYLVTILCQNWIIAVLIHGLFRNFYSTDVRYLFSFQPFENHSEAKPWYNAMQKHFGFKLKVIVLRNELSMRSFKPRVGVIPDVSMLGQEASWHENSLIIKMMHK